MARQRDLRAVVAAQARKSRERFLGRLEPERALATQEQLFTESVLRNSETAFGREHEFSKLKSFDDYRQRVPIRHYEELAPWIERLAGGEDDALTHQLPIRFWKTTGTTSQAKKIPVTPASATRTMESFLTLQGTQLHFHPELNERADTTLVAHISPKTIKEFLGPHRIPYCSTTELPVERRPGREQFTAPWLAPLQEVVEDDAVRLQFLITFAAAHELRSVTCLHPSRFHTIVSTLHQQAENLVQELAEGTILGEKCRPPLPELAGRLSQIWKGTGTLRPRDLWPSLSVLCSWSGSYIERYRTTMEQNFCPEFLPMPSISSEAFTTMTIDRNPVAQPLNIRGGLFEFIPAQSTVRADTSTQTFSELEVGQDYEIVLTSLGGLYRYATCDIFNVHSYEQGVPRMEYVGRRSVSDLTGEKLAEEQVEDVLREVLAEFSLHSSDYTLCAVQAESAQERPGYVLALESEAEFERAEELAERLDQRFKSVNSRYELKRNFEDLNPLIVRLLEPGTFHRYRQQRATQAPAGQLKDRVLQAQGRAVLEQLLKRPLESLG